MSSLTRLYANPVRGSFFRRLATEQYAQIVDALCIKDTAQGDTVKFSFTNRVSPPRIWDGKRVPKQAIARSQELVNKPWESSTSIPIPMLERDQTGALDRYVGEFAGGFLEHRLQLICDLIKNGGAATSGLAYDGQYFFDTDHSLGNSGTQKNVLTSSEVSALNVGTATGPTAEEAVDAIMGCIAYQMQLLDEEAKPFMSMDRDFLVICNWNLMHPFTAAVMANNLAGGETNALKAAGFNVKIACLPQAYSTPTTASAVFYVANVSNPNNKPFLLNDERDVSLKILDADSEYATFENAIFAGADWRGGSAYGEPLRMVQATLS